MRTCNSATVVVLLAGLFTLPGFLRAQSPPPHPPPSAVEAELAARPRIGLVLSGGGARGAAHVGILKVLEELRVPVDAIAGTSMGAIVGGLYASGLSTAELEEALTSVDWNRALTDKTGRDLLSYRRKQDDLSTAVKVRVGLKGWKPGLPLGIIQGQKLELLLRSLALPAATVEDFDELVVPFRAVAADLGTVTAVVLGEGDLVMAMRASMSVPLVFEPVKYEGGLLIDGGVADNLPVDVVRTMGVDVVIAVDIGSRLSKLDELNSAFAVNDQMVTGLMRRETDRQLASLGPGDIAIVPELGDYTAADFTKAEGIIPIGEAAAREAADQLGRYALSADAWTTYRAGRRKLGRAEPQVAAVRIVEDSDLSEHYIASLLTVESGQTFDAPQVEQDVERVFGLDLFERVGYLLHDAGPGQVDLEVEARRRSWGSDYVQFGLAMRSNLENRTGFDFTFRLNKLAVTETGGEWRTDLRLGENQMLRTEFYQPLTRMHSYFWAARASLRRQPVILINETGKEDLAYRLSMGGIGLDIGRAFDNWGEVRVGIDRESGTFRETDVSDLPAIDYEEARVYAFFGTDTYDDSAFPRNGLRTRVQASYSAEALGATDNIGRATFALDRAATRGRHTLILGLEGASFFDDAKFGLPYSLGGLGRLSGFGDARLVGRYTFLTHAVYYGQAMRVGLAAIEMPIYVGGSLELGNAWTLESQVGLDDLLLHGSVFLGIDSPIGPVYLGGGFGENDQRSAFFLIGRTF